MPQATRNINTDGPMTLDDGQDFFDKFPSAQKHLQSHTHQDKKRDGLRTQLTRDDQEQRETIAEASVEEGRLARDIQKSGKVPLKADGKGGHVANVDWQDKFITVRAHAKAAMAVNAHARKKIGPNVSDELRLFCATTRKRWREVEMPSVVDDRAPNAIIAESNAGLKEIELEEIEIQDANRTDAEVEKIIRADYARRKLAGAPKFGSCLQGGSFRHNGQFTVANPVARPQFPTAAAMVHAQVNTPVFVEVDDGLNFAIWADDDERILAKLLKEARAANAAQERTISESDKITMLREIGVRKLAAQRHLEAAYRYAEAQGLQFKRRPLPPVVLLWLELDTTAPAKDMPKVKAASPDFEEAESADT